MKLYANWWMVGMVIYGSNGCHIPPTEVKAFLTKTECVAEETKFRKERIKAEGVPPKAVKKALDLPTDCRQVTHEKFLVISGLAKGTSNFTDAKGKVPPMKSLKFCVPISYLNDPRNMLPEKYQ